MRLSWAYFNQANCSLNPVDPSNLEKNQGPVMRLGFIPFRDLHFIQRIPGFNKWTVESYLLHIYL
jgi:hypothetical protein